MSAALLLLTAFLVPASAKDRPLDERSITFLSPVYTIDRTYASMKGPQSTQGVTLLPGPRQVLWITGFSAVMVSSDGVTPERQEFMCHSNLDMVPELHRAYFGAGDNPSARLFTLSQGQEALRFPEGFGLPVMSDEPLSLTTQVLNHNVKGRTFAVRHRVTLTYVPDAALKRPLKPLWPSAVYGLALVRGGEGVFGVQHPDGGQKASSCLPGLNASSHTYTDDLGQVYTGHWVVPPGRQVSRTLVTKMLDLPYDTTVHAIAVHLHPFAESLELVDKTEGRSLFKSRAAGFADRIGLDRVESYSSREGIALRRSHDYELVAVYDNTSGAAQDSMAVMYLYLLDKALRKPRM